MSRVRSVLPALSLVLISGSLALAQSAAGSYKVAQTFHIGGEGGWDYLLVDSQHKLLYVPRTTHTLVLDAESGKTVADIRGQRHNHGVAIVPGAGRGFISDDASVDVFDLKTYQLLGKIDAADDADCIIYDPNCGKVLVSCGDAHSLAVIAPEADVHTGKATLVELGGKPEYLAAEEGKIYVNLVDKSQVAVIDSRTMTVIHRWPTSPGGSPAGMSIDPLQHRLFIGCRKPPQLVVMSSENGKVLAALPIGAGNDATQFAGEIFASCRDGSLAVARETSPGKFEIVETVATRPGAKTMGIDAATHTLYLPTAEFPVQGKRQGRLSPKPGSFMILVVRPQ